MRILVKPCIEEVGKIEAKNADVYERHSVAILRVVSLKIVIRKQRRDIHNVKEELLR